MPKAAHFNIIASDWNTAPLENADVSKGRWRWVKNRDNEIKFQNLNALSSKDRKKLNYNLKEIFVRMRVDLNRDLAQGNINGTYHFSDAQLVKLKQSIEQKYNAFLNKHRGICGTLYRLFVTPCLSKTKKQLINQIDDYKKKVVQNNLNNPLPIPQAEKDEEVLKVIKFELPEQKAKLAILPVQLVSEEPNPIPQPFNSMEGFLRCVYLDTADLIPLGDFEFNCFEDAAELFLQMKNEKQSSSGIVIVSRQEFLERLGDKTHKALYTKNIVEYNFSAFLRYLVLKDKIAGYLHPFIQEDTFSICVEPTEIKGKNGIFMVTKDKLLRAYKYLETHKMATVDDFSEGELKPELQKILNFLIYHNYVRYVLGTTYVIPLPNRCCTADDVGEELVKLLLKKGIIESWNIDKDTRQIYVFFSTTAHTYIKDGSKFAWKTWKTINDIEEREKSKVI